MGQPSGGVTFGQVSDIVDLSVCPQCGGPADNGHDREYPPNPYLCRSCMLGELEAHVDATMTQIGGDHYSKLAIQPVEYAMANSLNFLQGSVIKYVTRYKDKGGRQDLEKAMHCIQLLIEHEYGASKE